MINAATNARVRELTELIALERDPEKFSEFVAELNKLLDGEPVANAGPTKPLA